MNIQCFFSISKHITLIGKPFTISGRFLNYFSSNPLHQKIGIIKNLVDSAILLSDTKFHQENLKLASKFLILNGYPSHFINKHIRRRLRQIHARTSNHEFALQKFA